MFRPRPICKTICLPWLCFGISFLIGCSPQTPIDPYREGLLLSQSYSERYGEVPEPSAHKYLRYVSGRLLHSIPIEEAPKVSQLRFVLLDTEIPMAFSPGGGFILLSKGLIRNLRSEAELAFVIAHEIAHLQLEHVDLHLQKSYTHQPNDYQVELEREADKYAVGLIALANYDPRSAVYALNNANLAAGSPEGASHPEIFARSQEISGYIGESGWKPPGTVNRREFQKFKLALFSQNLG